LTNISDLPFQRPTWAAIDLDIIHSNYVEIRDMVNPAEVLAVIKSDAYGHGALVIGRELETAGVELFGTATAQEAIELRKGGIQTPIVVLSGLAIQQIPLLQQYDLIPSVYNFEFLQALEQFSEIQKRKVLIHVNVDTGMGRLGFTVEDAAIVLQKQYSYIRVEGVYTHFANADVLEDDYTRRQLEKFIKFIQDHQIKVRYFHTANSAAILNFPEAHTNLVRPGLILYGISPERDRSIVQRPILTLRSQIIALRKVARGGTIGYGRTFKASRDSVIATVPFGYADGLRRALSNRLEVDVRGTMCRIAGTISMDLCMLDVTDVPDVKLEDQVTFIGPKTTCWDWAKLLNTIPYEITCLIGARVPRVYYKGGQIYDVYYP
jgi:alanine racemase